MSQNSGGGKVESEFSRQRRAIRDLRIPEAGGVERAVLAAILARQPYVFATEKVLAAEAWVSVSSFKRACCVLEDAGVLDVERRARRAAFGATNVYRLNWAKIYELSHPIQEGVDPSIRHHSPGQEV